MITPRIEPVVLRYTIYFGIDLIGHWWHIFIFPAIGLAIIFLNLIIGYLLFLEINILAYFLMIGMAASQIIIGIVSILITLLNK